MLTLINFYTKILEKAEITYWIHRIDKFLKSEMPIYNSEVQEKWWRTNASRYTNGDLKISLYVCFNIKTIP